MKKLPLVLSAGMLSLALVLTGCSDASTPTDENTASSDIPAAVNGADEMFVTMMIPHHQQAIEMADIVLTKDGLDPRVANLAQQIKDAQGPEIKRMLGWLEEWGVDYDPDSSAGMDHGSMNEAGDGMMSEENMTALKDADATQASRLFLEQMIMHHEGAVEMARSALSDGQKQDVLDLAQQVIDDQTAEIAAMRELLDEL